MPFAAVPTTISFGSEGQYARERASILLCGPTGVGKTFIAQALGVQICRQRRRVVFTETNAFLADIRLKWSPGCPGSAAA